MKSPAPFLSLAAAVLLVSIAAGFVSVPIVSSDSSVQPPCEAAPVTSPCLHVRREGIVLPLTVGHFADWRLEGYRLLGVARYATSTHRELAVDVSAWFHFEPAPGDIGGKLDLAFPITMHSLFGPDDAPLFPAVWFEGVELPYDVAVNRAVVRADELGTQTYRGRPVHVGSHPLLERAADLRDVAPHLATAGHDMVLLLSPMVLRGNPNALLIEYTTGTNVDSFCCHGVTLPATTGEGYRFLFDLSGTRYWKGKRIGEVDLRGETGLFANVPDTGFEFTTDGRLAATFEGRVERDLVVPIQPAVFDVSPRTWPADALPGGAAAFRLERGALAAKTLRVEAVEATPGIEVEAMLPIDLTEEVPFAWIKARRTGARMVGPAYIDVTARNLVAGEADLREVATIRIPVAGPGDAGHDLAVGPLSIVADPETGAWSPDHRRLYARVSNEGLYAEDVRATIYVNRKFVRAFDLGRLAPLEERDVLLPVPPTRRSPSLIELEIDAPADETDRVDNRSSLILPRESSPRL